MQRHHAMRSAKIITLLTLAVGIALLLSEYITARTSIFIHHSKHSRPMTICHSRNIDHLISEIKSNVEYLGLRPLNLEPPRLPLQLIQSLVDKTAVGNATADETTITNNAVNATENNTNSNAALYYPGLDAELLHKAFSGKRILLFGDSTTENLNLWLHILLTKIWNDVGTTSKSDSESKPFPSNDTNSRKLKLRNTKAKPTNSLISPAHSSMANLNLTQAIDTFLQYSGPNCTMGINSSPLHFDWRCNGTLAGTNVRPHAIPKTNLPDGTAIQFVKGPAYIGRKNSYGYENGCPDFEPEYKTMKKFKPNVIMANMGLWWLHLQNWGRSQKGCVVKIWMEYEDFLENVTLAAEGSGAQLLVFKTTNHICTSAYVGDWVNGNHFYKSGDEETISRCIGDFKNKTMDFPEVDDDSIGNYCRYGTFNDVGTEYLNQRLVKFVERRRNGTRNGMHLEVLNDHDIQSCRYTEPADGRHYHPLNLVRMRILANLLSCYGAETVQK